MNIELLKKLRGDAIAYRPSFAKVLIGENRFGAEGAIYLQQLIFWCDKGSRPDGFIYKSKEEIYEETGITPKVQDRIRKVLVSLGCLETKLYRANGSPTLHYKLNIEKVSSIFLSITVDSIPPIKDVRLSPTGTMENAPRVETITEITTESTQKITTSDWKPVVDYFYSKISPETPFNRRYKKGIQEAVVHLRSLHSMEDIIKRVDALALNPDKFTMSFEMFCSNYSRIKIPTSRATAPVIDKIAEEDFLFNNPKHKM